MSGASADYFRWSKVDGVAVVEVLSREVSGPDMAREFGEQLRSLLRSGETRLLLNFGRTQIMTSTAFGTLLNFWKEVVAAGGELRICSMEPPVRFGADILSLGEYIPIHDDEPSALAAFSPGEGAKGG
jgi:anti-anti-sigma factor